MSSSLECDERGQDALAYTLDDGSEKNAHILIIVMKWIHGTGFLLTTRFCRHHRIIQSKIRARTQASKILDAIRMIDLSGMPREPLHLDLTPGGTLLRSAS